jgi:creatinine amidohydrolase
MSSALAYLVWPEAETGAADALLAVPLGATEQHGPHLPLSTDTEIAQALAEALVRRRPEVVVAPPIAYGSSGEHAGFPGTLSIGREATELVLIELGRSASATFSRTLLICAHGGNVDPVRSAEMRLRSEGHDVRAFFPDWPTAGHANRDETSLMLAIAPDRVRLDRAEVGALEPLSELLPQLVRRGVRSVSRNGVLGDPAGASATEGRALLERAVDEMIELMRAWQP